VAHDDWSIAPEAIAAACDARTRLVFLSHVSYRTGHRFDLPAVRAALDSAAPRALLAVDATQSLGVVPVEAAACDYLVASTCKWLLGAHGLAVFYWNRARRPDSAPRDGGWYSVVDDLAFPFKPKPDAGRFQLGAPAVPLVYALLPALELLDSLGLERVEAHALALGGTLLAGLRALDRQVITPDPPELRAGIVAWLDADPPTTASALAQRGVLLTGSSGRLRAGLHLYNDDEDVDRLLGALEHTRALGWSIQRGAAVRTQSIRQHHRQESSDSRRRCC
jgi:selenocysteine lyase/cysteine desulfurase